MVLGSYLQTMATRLEGVRGVMVTVLMLLITLASQSSWSTMSTNLLTADKWIICTNFRA